LQESLSQGKARAKRTEKAADATRPSRARARRKTA
jgi:hypothetical protein